MITMDKEAVDAIRVEMLEKLDILNPENGMSQGERIMTIHWISGLIMHTLNAFGILDLDMIIKVLHTYAEALEKVKTLGVQSDTNIRKM